MPGGATICAVFNCNNTRQNIKGQGIKLHNFPKDPQIRKQWIKTLGRPEDWIPTINLAVCSCHFTDDCYNLNSEGKIMKLKKGSVPSVFHPTQSKRLKLSEPSGEPSSVDASVPAHLENPESLNVDEVLSMALPKFESTHETDTSFHDAESSEQALAFHSYASRETTKSVGIQTSQPPKPMTKSVGTFVRPNDLGFKEPFPAPIMFSSPIVTSETKSVDEERVPKPSTFSQETLSNEANKHVSDITFEPSSETLVGGEEDYEFTEESFDSFPSELDPHLENKFIIFSSCLMTLFKICQICHKKPVMNIKRKTAGSLLCVTTECIDGHIFNWQSQPKFGQIAWGNYLLAACVYFSEILPTKCLMIFKHFKLQCFTSRMYFYYQRMFHPVIEKLWHSEQDKFLKDIKLSLNCCGDGRADSSGFNTKFGLYTFLNGETKKIIHLELVQSTEVKSSNQMEMEGLIRGLNFFHNQGVKINTFVSNHHIGITAHLRKIHPEITHEFDNWHLAKNIKKKLRAVVMTKGCEDLEFWMQSIINHLYWVAHSSKTREERIGKWVSLLNHICNIHQGHTKEFPNCLHGEIPADEERFWLNRETIVYEKIASIINAPNTLAAVAQLSEKYQIYPLDVFHSVLNSFATKRVHFHKDSTLSRTYLAALHFNENGQKAKQLNQQREEQYHLAYPKVKAGEPTAKVILEENTYDYVNKLLQMAYENALENSGGVDLMAPGCKAETLTSKDKSEVIAKKLSRFQ